MVIVTQNLTPNFLNEGMKSRSTSVLLQPGARIRGAKKTFLTVRYEIDFKRKVCLSMGGERLVRHNVC